jgi:hypothetical protein
MARYVQLSALAIVCTSLLSHGAVTGLGGLEAVAARDDGKIVAVAGQNRVVYIVDAETLRVKQRLWLGARIGNLAFNRDGSRLAVEEEDDRVRLLDLDSGKEVAKVANSSRMVASPRGNFIALRDTTNVISPRIRFLSLDDLTEKGRIELTELPSAFTFDAEAKRLIVLSRGVIGDEKRVPVVETPRDMRGLARAEYQQMHDGYESYLRTFDVATGKLLRQVRLWYTSDSDSTLLVLAGDTTFVFNRGNVCARISPMGKVSLLETRQRINHGLGSSPNGKLLLTGGLAEGTFGPLDGDKRVRFEIDELPGQAEFIARFAVRDDGGVFAVTTAYRLVRISREGKVEKAVPVY